MNVVKSFSKLPLVEKVEVSSTHLPISADSTTFLSELASPGKKTMTNVSLNRHEIYEAIQGLPTPRFIQSSLKNGRKKRKENKSAVYIRCNTQPRLLPCRCAANRRASATSFYCDECDVVHNPDDYRADVPPIEVLARVFTLFLDNCLFIQRYIPLCSSTEVMPSTSVVSRA